MTIWIDAQVSPDIAGWIIEQFQLSAEAVRDAGLRDSEDVDIFNAARAANSVVLTKDKDFVIFLNRFGPPPKLSCFAAETHLIRDSRKFSSPAWLKR